MFYCAVKVCLGNEHYKQTRWGIKSVCKEADILFEGIFIFHVIIFLKAGIM